MWSVQLSVLLITRTPLIKIVLLYRLMKSVSLFINLIYYINKLLSSIYALHKQRHVTRPHLNITIVTFLLASMVKHNLFYFFSTEGIFCYKLKLTNDFHIHIFTAGSLLNTSRIINTNVFTRAFCYSNSINITDNIC